jgi:exonuclease SbcC
MVLRNWKSHLNSEFTFNSGANVLVGIMGSGKTSVIEAISFALFGTFPALQSKRIVLDDLIMTKPTEKNSCSVELEFEVDGNVYTIKREIERGKGTKNAEIRKNGELLDVNPRNVTEIVERVLQMDYDLFSKAVYSEQNGIDYFLRIPKGHRMQHIDRMLKLDLYEKARENTVKMRNKLKTQSSELIKIISDMETENIEERFENIKKEIEALKEEEIKLKETDEKMKRDIEIFEKRLELMESKEKELIEITKEIESIRTGLNEVEINLKQKAEKLKGRDLSKLNAEIENLSNEIERYKKELDKNKEKEKELRSELASKNTKLKYLRDEEIPELEKKLNESKNYKKELLLLREKIPDPEKIIEEKTKAMENKKIEFYDMQSKRNELLKQIDDLKMDKCPTCEHPLTENKRVELITKKKREIREIEENLPKIETKIKRMRDELEEIKQNAQKMVLLKEKSKDYEETKKRLDNIEKEIKQITSDVNKIVKELEILTPKIAEIEESLENKKSEKERASSIIEDMTLIQELESKKLKYNERLKELETKEKEISASLKEVNLVEMRKELRNKIAEEREISTKLSGLEDKIRDRTEVLLDLKSRKETLEKYKKEVEINQKILKDLDSFVNVLKLTQQQLREEFVKTVNLIMNSIWEDLYPYGDFEEIRLTIDDDYLLQLKRAGTWLSVDGIVSGGERSMACLALRIAFSLAFIPNLRWLILDEPTHNLDINAIENFSTLLSEKIKKFTEQVFIITHEERISEGLENVYKLERNKALNEPTRVLKV